MRLSLSYYVLIGGVRDKDGYVRLYRVKESACSLKVSVGCIFGAAPLAILTIAYHVLRIPIVSLYLFGRIFYDGLNKRSWALACKRFCQIFEQIWLSLSTILRTPFCMLGFMLGHLGNIALDPMRYTHGDGLNARKFAAACEEYWNRGIPLHLSMGFVGLHKKGVYKFEGGGDPDKLGTSGYYLAACQQPCALLKLNEAGDAIIDLKTPGGNCAISSTEFTIGTDPGIGRTCCSRPPNGESATLPSKWRCRQGKLPKCVKLVRG